MIRRCPVCGVGHDVDIEYDEALAHYDTHGEAVFVRALRDCETLGIESMADFI